MKISLEYLEDSFTPCFEFHKVLGDLGVEFLARSFQRLF